MGKRPTEQERQAKDLLEEFISKFENKMEISGKTKYQLIPEVAIAMNVSTRTIENWLSRLGAKPRNPLTLAALRNWNEGEE